MGNPISLSTCAAKKTVPVFRCCTFDLFGELKMESYLAAKEKNT